MHDQTPVQLAWPTRHRDGVAVPHLDGALVSPKGRAFFDNVKQEQQ